MTTLDEMIAVARSHLGEDGWPTRRWYNATIGNIGNYKWEWCQAFITKVAAEADVDVLYRGAACSHAVNAWKNAGRWNPGVTNIKPGDIVEFDWNPSAGDGPEHVGIVEAVNNGSYVVIEGNHNDKCERVTRYPSQILGFFRPTYSAGAKPPTASMTTTIYQEETMYWIRNNKNGSVNLLYSDGTRQPISNPNAYSGLVAIGVPGKSINEVEYAATCDIFKAR